MENKGFGDLFSKYNKLNITDEHKDIAKFIRDISPKSKDIIDIGCGGGEYSICMANLFEHVYALDISKIVIDKLYNSNIPSNIKTINMDYNDYCNTHDISFLSFSPVINNIDDITKLMNNTNDYIFILTVDNGSMDYHRRNLMKDFPPINRSGFIKNADWYRTNLGNMNISYNEKLFSNTTTELIEASRAKSYFIEYFRLLGYQDILDKINEYVDNNSINGYLEETHILNKALIYFKIK